MQRRKLMAGSWRRTFFVIVGRVFNMHLPIHGLNTQHASAQNKYISVCGASKRANKYVIDVGRVTLQ